MTQATLFEGCDPKPLPPSDTLRDELERKRVRRPRVVIRKLTAEELAGPWTVTLRP